MKWLLGILIAVILAAGLFFYALFLSERPSLGTDPATLAGDGSALDYCRLPVLDGSGKAAAEIPKGNTPGCGYDHFPLPILADCTEPLPADAADLRGLWVGVEGGHVGHVERVEQCGRRVVVTSSGIIHDYGPNASGGLNTDDTEGSVLFTIGERFLVCCSGDFLGGLRAGSTAEGCLADQPAAAPPSTSSRPIAWVGSASMGEALEAAADGRSAFPASTACARIRTSQQCETALKRILAYQT